MSTPTFAVPSDPTLVTDRNSTPVSDRGRILIVEDEPGLAEVLSLHLEAAGFETTVCHDGLSAIYELDRATFRVVLLDLHLPEAVSYTHLTLPTNREV